MSEIIILNRLRTSDDGTFGEILRHGLRKVVTCELPWNDNIHRVSCIPKGTYNVTRFNSPSKGDVFLLHDVPNRSMIEIHPANVPTELLGCIAPGLEFGEINGKPAVLSSKLAFKMLWDTLPESFQIEVIGVV